MAVTKTAYTDFFVFTTHGNLLERIDCDPSFWADLLMKLEWFWINCLAPEIITRAIQRKSQDNQSHEHSDTSSNAKSSNSFEIISSALVSVPVSSGNSEAVKKNLIKTKVQDWQNLQNTRRDKSTKKFVSVVAVRVNVLMNQKDLRNTV